MKETGAHLCRAPSPAPRCTALTSVNPLYRLFRCLDRLRRRRRDCVHGAGGMAVQRACVAGWLAGPVSQLVTRMHCRPPPPPLHPLHCTLIRRRRLQLDGQVRKSAADGGGEGEEEE